MQDGSRTYSDVTFEKTHWRLQPIIKVTYYIASIENKHSFIADSRKSLLFLYLQAPLILKTIIIMLQNHIPFRNAFTFLGCNFSGKNSIKKIHTFKNKRKNLHIESKTTYHKKAFVINIKNFL